MRETGDWQGAGVGRAPGPHTKNRVRNLCEPGSDAPMRAKGYRAAQGGAYSSSRAAMTSSVMSMVE